MKITKARLKEIIKEEVQNTITEKSDEQKELEQASRAIVSGLDPEEQTLIATITTMLVKYAKKRNLEQGEVARRLKLLFDEVTKQMKLPATPPEEASVNEEDLDEMSTAGGVTASVEGAPAKEQ